MGIIQTQSRGKKSSLRKGSADIQDMIYIQKELLRICTEHDIALVIAEESAGSSKGTRGGYEDVSICNDYSVWS